VGVVVGDLSDPAGLESVCDGIDTVVATATVIGRRLAGARHPSIREVDERGMAALIDVAENAGVERFVYVSFAGIERSLGTTLDRASSRPSDG
jgi:nucleoside-diphosphate-sugar epimerase